MESKKNDRQDDKLRWDLLPLETIEEIVKVYHAGAKKYGENTWQNLPDGYNRYKGAMFRHLVLHEKGEVFDEETGCRHLAQVAWNAIAMLHCCLTQFDCNDTPPFGNDKPFLDAHLELLIKSQCKKEKQKL
jgi:hypothetical protein